MLKAQNKMKEKWRPSDLKKVKIVLMLFLSLCLGFLGQESLAHVTVISLVMMYEITELFLKKKNKKLGTFPQ